MFNLGRNCSESIRLTILRIWNQRSDGICVINSVYLEGQSHLLHKLSIFSVLIISFIWTQGILIDCTLLNILICINMYILDYFSFFWQYFLVHFCLSGIFWFDNLKNVWFKGIGLVLQMYFFPINFSKPNLPVQGLHVLEVQKFIACCGYIPYDYGMYLLCVSCHQLLL